MPHAPYGIAREGPTGYVKLRHRHPYLEPHAQDEFVPFAHRGGVSLLPENSIVAFREAWNLGFRYLETDVQITRDGHLVAFHDANLKRTCGIDRLIADMSAAEVRQLRIDGSEPVPFLADLFEEFPQAMINLDAKSNAVVEPLTTFLSQGNNLSRVCIGSFSHSRLVRIRGVLGDAVCTSASPVEVASWVSGRVPGAPSCFQVPIRQYGIRILSRTRVHRAHEQGLPVHVWTINEADSMQTMIDSGVHGIMTDNAQTLKAVVQRNALWP